MSEEEQKAKEALHMLQGQLASWLRDKQPEEPKPLYYDDGFTTSVSLLRPEDSPFYRPRPPRPHPPPPPPRRQRLPRLPHRTPPVNQPRSMTRLVLG